MTRVRPSLPSPLTFVLVDRNNCRDSEDSRSEDDREEEQGGFWIPYFTDVVQKKSSQILDLEQFGGEVPPCSAWNESPRYAAFSLPFESSCVSLNFASLCQIVCDTAHDVANRRREGGGHPRGRSQPAP